LRSVRERFSAADLCGPRRASEAHLAGGIQFPVSD
jgi:hypothetical protein